MATNSLLAKFLPGGRLVHKMDTKKREEIPRQHSDLVSPPVIDQPNSTNMQKLPSPQLQRTPSSSSSHPPLASFSSPYATPQQSFIQRYPLQDSGNNTNSNLEPMRYPTLQSPSFSDFSSSTIDPQGQPAQHTQVPPQTPPTYKEIAPRPASVAHVLTPKNTSKIVLKSKPSTIDSNEDTIQYAAPKRKSLRAPKQNMSLKALENVNGLLDSKDLELEHMEAC